MKSYAKELRQEGIAEALQQGIAQAHAEAGEAENKAVRNYVDQVRHSGMEESAIIKAIESIWGWSQEKARSVVLGAAT